MKMTRLEWTYLKRIALDHPYYDTHKLPLTEAEAMAIVDENNTMTGREFVDSVYAKLGKTRPVKEKRRFDKLRSFAELFTVPPIRRIAIVVLIVIFMTVFFAATPTGRAIAESVIQYITRIYQDGSLALYQSDSEAVPVSKEAPHMLVVPENTGECYFRNEVQHIDTFEEFAQRTGRTPYILPLEYTELYYYVHDESVDLFAEYRTSNGIIIADQTWDEEAAEEHTSTGYIAYPEDHTVFYSIEENGDINCIKVLEDSILIVYAKGCYFSMEEIILLLDPEFMQH